MKQKKKPLILLRILINLILVATAALLVECVVFQFPALYYKEKPQDIICDGSDPRVEIQTKNALAKLSDEEIRSIEVEQSNQKLLAEYQGEVYEEKLDENLVKKDGTLYRKVKKTVIDAALSQPYYIHKLDLRVPVTESAGYSVELYLDGKKTGSVYCSIDPKISAGIANISDRCDRIKITLLTNETIDNSKIQVTLSNRFGPNSMRLFFLFVLFGTGALLYQAKTLLRDKPEWIFAILCFALGSLLICGIGTNQVSYDEYVHAKAAYKLSFGTTIESTESAIQMAGNLLPFFHNPEERQLVEAYEDKNNDYSWADIGHQSRFVRSETRVYYPMAIGFKLGRMLHLRFADTVALAKFGNLLFYILVVFFAIRLAKRYQGLVALVALLPNSVFLASALTYDAVVNSFLLLGMVLVTNELITPEEKLTWQNTLLILLSFAIGCQSKPIYVVMVLMLLFLGRKKFYNRPQEIVYKLALLIMAGLMLYNIFRPTPAAGSDYYLVGNFDFAGDKRNIGTSVTGQLQYILQNPFTYALLLLKSMVQLLGTYLSGGADFFQYGYLGTGSTIFTWIVIVLGLWLALWSAKGVKRRKMPAVSIVLTLIMLLGTSAIVWSSMYVSYTTVGANEIRGVQGRYFIPLFLPFASCFFNNRLESRLGELARRRILYGVMMAVNLFMIYTLVITVINI